MDITYAPSLSGPIPFERPDPTKPNPRIGVGHLMSWSHDGRYLATRNDNMASVLWVWDAEDLGLSSVVVQVIMPFGFFVFGTCDCTRGEGIVVSHTSVDFDMAGFQNTEVGVFFV